MAKNKRAKPRNRNALVDLLNGALSLLVIAMLLAGGLFFFGLNRFYSAGNIPQETTFLVESGSSLGVTAERLETQGLIDNRMIFQAAGMALKKQGKLKAGEFKIAAHSSMSDILTELTEGTPVLYGVTVPEGFTSWQVIERINADSHLIGDIGVLPAEGSILPNTYSYIPGDTRQSVLDKMQAAQKKAVEEIWANRDPDLPVRSPEDLITLASVIEKETGVATERPQVAAVFVNRLKKGMRLQSDPTIIYGITKGQAPLGRGLKKSEIEAKTPYNTYQIDGLPVGPIANPGIESLRAAANPAKTKDLYFVAAGATPAEGHLFAATYADHRKNVAKWRVIEKQMAVDAQAAAEADLDAAKDAIEAEQAKETGDTTTAQ